MKYWSPFGFGSLLCVGFLRLSAFHDALRVPICIGFESFREFHGGQKEKATGLGWLVNRAVCADATWPALNVLVHVTVFKESV